MSFEQSHIVLPKDFGFCGGVAAADQLAEQTALQAREYSIPVYGLHEIVHNKDVVRKHEEAGVHFVDDLDEVPTGSAVIISAHGVGPETIHAISEKKCLPVDATCPLVIHTHKGAEHARKYNEKVVYVCHGKPGEVSKLHDEVAGMVGHLDFKLDEEGALVRDPIERFYLELDEELGNEELLTDTQKYRIITQTTLHADDSLRYREEIKNFILSRQPDAKVSWANKGDVCRAVADRQKGVEQLVELRPRYIVVATDPGSKNGMGYVALAQELATQKSPDTKVFAVANAKEASALPDTEGLIGLTASASTPDKTIQEIAAVFNAEPSSSSDKVFTLADAREGVLSQKLADHALRLANE